MDFDRFSDGENIGPLNDDFRNPHIIRAAVQAWISTTLRELTISKDAHQSVVFTGLLSVFTALKRVYTKIRCLLPRLSFSPLNSVIDIFALLFPHSIKVIHVCEVALKQYCDCRELIFLAIRAKSARDFPTPMLEQLMFELSTKAHDDALTSVRHSRNTSGFRGKTLEERCGEVRLSLVF